jgi:hypothetical protein
VGSLALVEFCTLDKMERLTSVPGDPGDSCCCVSFISKAVELRACLQKQDTE